MSSSVYFDRELADTIERRAVASRLCAVPGCSVRAVTCRVRDSWGTDWWFCHEHASGWRVHNQIVKRILEIPPRDAQTP